MLPLFFAILTGLAGGAAVGYYLPEIIDALSRAFKKLWEGLVAAVKKIYDCVSKAIRYFLALLVKALEGVKNLLARVRQAIGYHWCYLVEICRQGRQIFARFIEPSRRNSVVINVSVLEDTTSVQLPENQRLAAELVLN